MITTDIYHALFGKNHPTDGSVVEIAEHGRVGGVSTGKPFKYVAFVDPAGGTSPTVTDGKLDVNATVNTGDIEIGAVEIKNAGDDTRATVDANGLWTRSTVKETAPTDATKSNPSTVLSYNATTELVRVVKTINGTSYTKNVTPLSGDTVITQTKTFGVWT
jgi:hypothetical protein